MQDLQPTQEESREMLFNRCMDAMGGMEPVLAKVLSYFPDEAELFIRTQKYAAKIHGRKGIWYSVRHEKPGYGLNGNEFYSNGQLETLGIKGFTGQPLFKTISEIKELRGKGEVPGRYIGGDTYEISKILKLAGQDPSTMEIWDKMTAKIIEVMGVTSEELNLLSQYLEADRKYNELNAEARSLENKAKNLREQATQLSEKARDTIENRFKKKQ